MESENSSKLPMPAFLQLACHKSHRFNQHFGLLLRGMSEETSKPYSISTSVRVPAFAHASVSPPAAALCMLTVAISWSKAGSVRAPWFAFTCRFKWTSLRLVGVATCPFHKLDHAIFERLGTHGARRGLTTASVVVAVRVIR